jgi:fructose-1,6-bisphosphatase/inositol monophosphatase family enzyme
LPEISSASQQCNGDPSGAQQPWTVLLVALHNEVRRVVRGCERGTAGRTNAKGDDVRLFDLAANAAAVDVLKASATPLLIVSEEAEPLEVGPGRPRYRLVLDPVDGSDNWARKLPLSASSCAVLAVDSPLHPDWVEAAMVGPLEEETPLIALKGSGAWRGSRRLAVSSVQRIGDALISVELNHLVPPAGLASLVGKARGVRSYGCASRALALVAAGAIDAHVDVRGRLTAESYLSAARLVIEAGGCVGGIDGSRLRAVRSLTDGVALIAASSQSLCDEIVERLGDDGS